ncbi:MAG TPA: helix-turn-helix transcriptional regulator [Gemmatimonadaceae bacterium]|jgi:DNA-binding Xre family transcriptional regulator
MRLRVPELLAEKGMTAYELAKRSGDRISLSAAYRLARGEWRAISSDVLDALCDVLEIDDPGPLFERDDAGRRKNRR